MLELLWMVLMACAGTHAAPSVTNLATVDELMNKLRVEPVDTPVFLVQIRDGDNQPDFIFDDTINTATSNSPSNNNVYILRLFETPKTATTTTTAPPPVVHIYAWQGGGHHHHHHHVPHRHHHHGLHHHHHHGWRGKRQQSEHTQDINDLEDLKGQMTDTHQDMSLYVVIIKSGDDEALPLMKALRYRIWLQASLRTIYVSRLSAETGTLRPILSIDIRTTNTYTVPNLRPIIQVPPVVHVYSHNHPWHHGHTHHHGHRHGWHLGHWRH